METTTETVVPKWEHLLVWGQLQGVEYSQPQAMKACASAFT